VPGQPIEPGLGLIESIQKLGEHQPMGRRAELQTAEPDPVLLAPGLAQVTNLLAQQKAANALPAARQVRYRGTARPHQIAQSLVRPIGHPDRGQLPGPQQSRQDQTVAPVGLDPNPGAARRQRRRNHLAGYPRLVGQPTVDAVAARTSLVTHHKLACFLAQALEHAIQRPSLVRDLAKVANLATGQRLRYRNVDPFLVCIQSNVERILDHERSPMFEARRRPIRRNPRICMRRGRSLQPLNWTYGLRRPERAVSKDEALA